MFSLHDSEGSLFLSFDLTNESSMLMRSTHRQVDDTVQLGAWGGEFFLEDSLTIVSDHVIIFCYLVYETVWLKY